MARVFTLQDQERFARLSGDRNELHIDPLAARRTMLGGVAVHGIHLVLWALDVLSAEHPLPGFSRLRVQFLRGVLVGSPVDCVWQIEQERLVGKVTGESGTFLRISVAKANCSPSSWSSVDEAHQTPCEEHELENLEGRSGDLPLALAADWAGMFPSLAAEFPPAIVATLLATTRLVGMVVPGRYSIYGGLELQCQPGIAPGRALSYRVISTDARFQLVTVAVEAGGLEGTVTAFLRPKLYTQKALNVLLPLVRTDEFAGQEAIVIGGARGLGELAAKLLAAGGARVTITWLSGEPEAQAIAAEGAALGKPIVAQAFDATAPPWKQAKPEAPYTHLYYFATPRIPAGQPGRFNSGIFAQLLEIYVTGLARTLEWFLPRSQPNATIWYPSTVFLEQPDPYFAEYAAAKSCAEALCRQLSESMAPLQFAVERLPRLATDQTQALTAVELGDGPATLLQALRRQAQRSSAAAQE
jgi:NAD(P)-dependent dehydrogenase (short-subunit alcohol dehydrogenase family)